MNCKRLQLDLSQAFDGRLPAGRRREVLAHLDECASCAAMWRAMERMRELVENLPRQRPGVGFHEALWRRIHSGEGTPEAVFRDPVPTASKVRYVLAGALAAAVVLVVGRSWTAAPAPLTKARAPLEVARAAQGGGSEPAPERSSAQERIPTPVFTAPHVPLNPASLATTGAMTLMATTRRLRECLERCGARRGGGRGVPWKDVLESARRLQAAARAMRWLESSRHVAFLPDVDEDLRRAEQSVALLFEKRDVGRALAQLKDMRPDRLRRGGFRVLNCCPDPVEFLSEMIRDEPEVSVLFPVDLGVLGSWSGPGQPGGSMTMRIHIATGRTGASGAWMLRLSRELSAASESAGEHPTGASGR